MKRLIISLLVFMSGTVYADNILNDMPNVQVHQDASITRLMNDKREGIVRGLKETTGWRVQIYSSNQQQAARNEAENIKKQYEELIDQPIYIVSQQPFWKVRIGNFLQQEQAKIYMEQLLEMFPELQGTAYIVRDEHVKVMQ